ncbi:hypothetical protein, conserved [Eimeria maxima]|uniref:Serine aminopeptidase S33 domain-containing protein n=1 Tax=Eimeria maxima TaxID=5804 RepID=U6M349_EIMMA|nr:hypothetical protein, conserved [Eimeria maxima]CDJ58642.1 hypothetical protein, conserved [Eimeria maxima]
MARKQKPSLPSPGEALYPLDGNPEKACVVNTKGLKLTIYAWRVQKPKAAVLFIHGVQTHARFEFLRHLSPEEPDIALPAATGGTTTAANGASAASEAATQGVGKDSCGSKQGERQYLRWCIYEGSWVQQLNNAGCSVYAGDLESFGLSEGWKARRCSVERLDDLGCDVISFAEFVAEDLSKQSQQNSDNHMLPPICLVGISMGGFSVIRALELMGERNHWLLLPSGVHAGGIPVPVAEGAAADGNAADGATPEGVVAPPTTANGTSHGALASQRAHIVACVGLAPMLAIEKASSGAFNRAIAKVSGVLSKVTPHVGAVKLPPARLRWVDVQKDEDPLVTCPLKIPCRMAAEVLTAVPRVHAEAKSIPQHIRLKIIHAREDSIVEPQGSIRFINESATHITERQLQILEGERGHYLVIEPGNEEVLRAIKEWFKIC